jgi:hypothetical protein
MLTTKTMRIAVSPELGPEFEEALQQIRERQAASRATHDTIQAPSSDGGDRNVGMDDFEMEMQELVDDWDALEIAPQEVPGRRVEALFELELGTMATADDAEEGEGVASEEGGFEWDQADEVPEQGFSNAALRAADSQHREEAERLLLDYGTPYSFPIRLVLILAAR